MVMYDPKLDSLEGITIFISWAKKSNIVINLYHEKLAHKYQIDLTDVRVSRPISLS